LIKFFHEKKILETQPNIDEYSFAKYQLDQFHITSTLVDFEMCQYKQSIDTITNYLKNIQPSNLPERNRVLYLYMKLAARLKTYGRLELSASICYEIMNLCHEQTVIDNYFRAHAYLLLNQFNNAIFTFTNLINTYESTKDISAFIFHDFDGKPVLIHSQAYQNRALTKILKIPILDRSANYFYNEALVDCSHAIRLQPTNFEAINNQALIYIALRQLQLAYTEVNTSLLINPNNPRTYKLRGLIYTQDNKIPNALQDFIKTVTLDPHDIEAQELVNMYTVKPKNGKDEYKSHIPPVQKDRFFFKSNLPFVNIKYAIFETIMFNYIKNSTPKKKG